MGFSSWFLSWWKVFCCWMIFLCIFCIASKVVCQLSFISIFSNLSPATLKSNFWCTTNLLVYFSLFISQLTSQRCHQNAKNSEVWIFLWVRGRIPSEIYRIILGTYEDSTNEPYRRKLMQFHFLMKALNRCISNYRGKIWRFVFSWWFEIKMWWKDSFY